MTSSVVLYSSEILPLRSPGDNGETDALLTFFFPEEIGLPLQAYQTNNYNYTFEIKFTLTDSSEVPLYRSRVYNPTQKSLGNVALQSGVYTRERIALDANFFSIQRESQTYSIPTSDATRPLKYGLESSPEWWMSNVSNTTLCMTPANVVDPSGVSLVSDQLITRTVAASMTLVPLTRPVEEYPELAITLLDEGEIDRAAIWIAPGVEGAVQLIISQRIIGDQFPLYSGVEFQAGQVPTQANPPCGLGILSTTAAALSAMTCDCVKAALVEMGGGGDTGGGGTQQ